jgi:hypothetical protein
MSLVTRSALAALVLAVPVGAELIWPSFGDRGHLVFASSQILGWVLIATVIRGGADRHPRLDSTRGGRLGRRSLLTGCLLQVLFALAYGVTALINGDPFEGSFVLFLLGFLALFVGGMAWGQALLRLEVSRKAGLGALATGVLGLLAILVGTDPFHDVFLLSSYAAWILVGFGVEEPATSRACEVSAASR